MFASRAVLRSSGLRAVNTSVKASVKLAARPLSTSAFRLSSAINDKTAAENAVHKFTPAAKDGLRSQNPQNPTLDKFKLTGKVAVVTGYVTFFFFFTYLFLAVAMGACLALIVVWRSALHFGPNYPFGVRQRWI